MMITIHGFPATTKYQDVKILIKKQCNINDFILDNLINDADGSKKVRIGLTDNTEGYKVMKCLDGYRLAGNFVLKAIPVGKAASSLPPQQSTFDSRPGYQNQTRNDYSGAPRNDYMGQPTNDYNSQGSHGPGPSHSHGGIHGSSGPHSSHVPRPSHSQGGPHVSGGSQGSIDMSRPSPWASGGNNSSQWNSPMVTQVPQNTFGFTSPQANINPSYGQQHQPHHPRAEVRPGFSQGRATDQGYGYTPKSNVPEVVPANSRYRWVRKTEPESIVPKSPHSDDDCASPSADDTIDEKLQDVLNDLEKQSPDETSNLLDSSGTKISKKAWKREQAKLRNISNLTGAQRRRLYFWLKRGKPFMEARQLCEIRVNMVPEYPAAKAEKKRKAREVALRRMSPERRERAIKVDRLKGRGLPGMPPPERVPCQPIRVRIFDELGIMSQEKIYLLQDKILELVDAETDGNGPNFVGCMFRAGCIILSCANKHTLAWLEKNVPNFQLWEGAQIKVINISELPKPVMGVAFVADPNLDDEAILKMLKSQNSGIDFSDWWITSKKPELPAGQTVTFSIDIASVDKLAERNYFVYLGLKKTKIRIKTKKSNAPTRHMGVPAKSQMGNIKRNMDMSRMGQKGKRKQGEMPSMKQIDVAPMEEMGMTPMPPMGMGQMGMSSMEHMGMPPMGPMGMGAIGPMGMGQMGMPYMGPMGMSPMGPMGMSPMGPMGMPPMGPMGMPPMGPMGMAPMGQMGMAPMGQMGFESDASTSAVMCGPHESSSYTSSFSQRKQSRGSNKPKHVAGENQPKNYGGGNQPKQFRGGNQPKHFGGGNQPKQFAGGNQSKQFGGRNQPKQFGGGNQPKQLRGGNQPKQFGGGNQPKQFGGGNQPKQFDGGNQPKQFGGGNQPKQFRGRHNKKRGAGNNGGGKSTNANPGPFKNEWKKSKREPKSEPPF